MKKEKMFDSAIPIISLISGILITIFSLIGTQYSQSQIIYYMGTIPIGTETVYPYRSISIIGLFIGLGLIVGTLTWRYIRD
jgi:hypothetical protein